MNGKKPACVYRETWLVSMNERNCPSLELSKRNISGVGVLWAHLELCDFLVADGWANDTYGTSHTEYKFTDTISTAPFWVFGILIVADALMR